MFIDYYSLLNIAPNASQIEIKAAFKKQALKWHPDKNPGIDTTEMMQNINEAYLILKDQEAKKLYDAEYLRFNKFKKEQEKSRQSKEESKSQKQQSNKSENKDYSYESEENYQGEQHEYSSYNVVDETLKKWMNNARTQAINLAQQTIEDFRGMSIESGKAIGDAVLSGIVKYVVFGVLMLILFKACNN